MNNKSIFSKNAITCWGRVFVVVLLSLASLLTSCNEQTPSPVAVGSIGIHNQAGEVVTTLSIEEGQQVNLSAAIEPANASDRSVTWTSSNENVATISPSGLLTIRGKAGDSCTITIRSNSAPGISASIEITVTATTVPLSIYAGDDPVSDASEFSLSVEKPTIQMSYNSSDFGEGLSASWTSSNENVLTVDQSGLVSRVGPGYAYVTLTLSNGASDEAFFVVPGFAPLATTLTVSPSSADKSVSVAFAIYGNTEDSYPEVPTDEEAETLPYTITKSEVEGENNIYIFTAKEDTGSEATFAFAGYEFTIYQAVVATAVKVGEDFKSAYIPGDTFTFSAINSIASSPSASFNPQTVEVTATVNEDANSLVKVTRDDDSNTFTVSLSSDLNTEDPNAENYLAPGTYTPITITIEASAEQTDTLSFNFVHPDNSNIVLYNNGVEITEPFLPMSVT